MKQIIQNWINKADADFNAAKALSGLIAIHPEIICFHIIF